MSQVIAVLSNIVEVERTITAHIENMAQWMNAVREERRRLLVFLSYRFEPSSKDAVEKLKKFFRALDVDVITGEEYEPRPVSEKIQALLELPLDCTVLVVMKGQSFWTRDEIAIAKAKGIPVVPLIAKAASFKAGIFGDLEKIRFEQDHIEQTFTDVLEAMRYIKLHRRKKPEATV